MAGVAISLVSGNQAGGSGSDTITTTEYASSTEAEAAITSHGVLPVTTPLAADGTALKKRHVPVASIREIVSL